jgi:hypothetical protein
VKPLDDKHAKRLAELNQQLEELDREDEQRAREVAEREAGGGAAPVARRVRRRLTSFLFVVGVLVLVAVLAGVAVTLNRLAGNGMGDAPRLGQAMVSSCVRHGPITTHGFGYWETCRVTITWADGEAERLTVDEVFKSADIGTPVQVGDPDDANRYNRDTLARADAASRPWLRWMSYGVGVVAALPLFVLGLLFGVVPGPRKKKVR